MLTYPCPSQGIALGDARLGFAGCLLTSRGEDSSVMAGSARRLADSRGLTGEFTQASSVSGIVSPSAETPAA